MATFVLDDATIWVHGYDFTTDTNQVNLNVTADQLDSTTFGAGGWRTRTGGLKSVESQIAGFWQADTSSVDSESFPDLGTADRVVTLAPDSAETTPCYMFQAGKFTYQAFGQIGELTPYSLNMAGTNGVGVVRGQVLKAKGDVSATGATGTAVELGAVADGQYLYATLHVFSAGTTITAVLESDADNTFASATTQATFSAITTTGGTWATRVAGPLTDTWYRLRVTACTGTFTVAAAAGIGS